MTEENREIYGRAFTAAKDIETAARCLSVNIGYWDVVASADSLAQAERHLARLCAHTKEMALALADMRRVIYECEEEKEDIHVD